MELQFETEEIHSCWFCGSGDTCCDEEHRHPVIELVQQFWVLCRMCGARGPVLDNKDESIFEWNLLEYGKD